MMEQIAGAPPVEELGGPPPLLAKKAMLVALDLLRSEI
jgi:hypothetical protein